jgi:polysaccharide biosynthesis transport protein
MTARGTSPSLLDYLHVLSRRKWTFLVTFLLVPIAAVALSLKQTPVYEATADVLLKPPIASDIGGVQTGTVDPARFAETQALLARVPDVAEAALRKVPGADLTVEEFLKNSGVVQTPGGDYLTFTFKSSNPGLATALATAYAKAFTQYSLDNNLQRYRDHLQDVGRQIDELTAAGDTHSRAYKDLAEDQRVLTAQVDYPDATAQVVRDADKSFKIAPRTKRNGAIAVVLGMILGLGAAFLAEALDTRVRTVDAVRNALGIPVLGQLRAPSKSVAKQGKLVMLAAPASVEAESFRTLRANLAFANAHHKARVLMITSALDEEGKSTTAANLALVLARGGRSVVLIDADLRSPRLHELFDLDEKPGLTDLELGDAELDDALREIQMLDANERGGRDAGTLEVLPAGAALHDPDELGAEAAVARIVREVRSRADFVLVDAAPLLRVGDAVALSAYVDALLVVVRLQSLRSATLDELERTLASTPTAKLGVIVTGAPPAEGADYSHYGQRRGSAVVQKARPKDESHVQNGAEPKGQAQNGAEPKVEAQSGGIANLQRYLRRS